VGPPGIDDGDPIVGDDILPDVLTAIATAHHDDGYRLSRLAIDLDVRQAEDVVGQKRDDIAAEFKRRKIVLDLDCAPDGDPGAGKCPEPPMARTTIRHLLVPR
jgi:hypothetical protein